MATKIFIDPGHGGTDPGAVGKWNMYGGQETTIQEKDLALDFAKELKSTLEYTLKDVTCYLSRSDDSKLTIASRANDAFNKKVDALISIHFNSFTTSSVEGTETFYANTRSGDKAFAEILQNEIIDGFGTNDRGVKNDTQSGVGSLGILRNNSSGSYPRALIEVEFISNKTAMNRIGSEYADRIYDFCHCIVRAVKEYFGLTWA